VYHCQVVALFRLPPVTDNVVFPPQVGLAVAVTVGSDELVQAGPKFAVMDLAPLIVTVKGLLVLDTAPDQLTKTSALDGTAVKVTVEFSGKLAELNPPAVLMPVGELVTLPVAPPAPTVATDKLRETVPPLIVALKSSVLPY
jgi:hypothetical protein